MANKPVYIPTFGDNLLVTPESNFSTIEMSDYQSLQDANSTALYYSANKVRSTCMHNMLT